MAAAAEQQDDQPPPAHEGTTEADRIETWRAHMLVQAGYPGEIAWQLASDLTVDLHAACQLLRHGCTLRVALQILAPLA